MKYSILLILTVLTAAFVFGSVYSKVYTRCADFSSKEEAQRIFSKDPLKYKRLDKDKDAVPCENFQYERS